MKQREVFLFSGLLLVLGGVTCQAGIVSPAGRFRADFCLTEGRPHIALSINGRRAVDIALGVVTDIPYKTPLSLVRVVPASFSGVWKPVWGDRAAVDESYNGEMYELKDVDGRQMAVETRLYNQGFAFRYRLQEKGRWKLVDEKTEFRFVEDAEAWAIADTEDTYPDKPISIHQLVSKQRSRTMMPLTVRLPDGGLISVAEAYVRNCARARLRGTGSGVAVSFLGKAPAAAGFGAFEMPWRAVMMARDEKELLLQGDLIPNLNPPCALADTSWILPGLSVSDADGCPEVGPEDTFVCPLTTERLVALGETFADVGFRYLQVDWGWYGTERRWSAADCEKFRRYHPDLASRTDWVENAKADMMTVAHGYVPYEPDWGLALDVNLDLAELVKKLRRKDMGVCLYLRGKELEKTDLEALFSRYEQWGIAGIKPGFVSYGDARSTEWIRRLVETAAKHRLWVDIHDAEVPDGKRELIRTCFLRKAAVARKDCIPLGRR